MMQRRSTGGERVTAGQLRSFEGLVFSTARMFAAQVRREEDDLAQELRIVVWRAVSRFDPTRSNLPLERYVFGAITNKIRDYKRDAAREYDRRQRNGLTFLHIEDMSLSRGGEQSVPEQEAFDGRYHFVERDEVYRCIDEGKFVLPSSVTEREASILLLLMMEMTKPEIMLRLRLTRHQVDSAITSLRAKFADWHPGQRANSSRVVSLAVAAA